MIGFEWLKNGNFIFTWGWEQCTHTMYHSSPYISGVLHGYKKSMKDVFVQYADRYKTSYILFKDEGEYHLEDNAEDNSMYNYLKMSSCWKFDSSHERELSIKTLLCALYWWKEMSYHQLRENSQKQVPN